MVQTRRQSQLGDGEGVNGTADSKTTGHTSTSHKGATGGTDNLQTEPRKRRKVTATKYAIALSGAVAEMGDTIRLLPSLPVRLSANGKLAEQEAREPMTSRASQSHEAKVEAKEPPKATHTRFASEDPEPQTITAAAIPQKSQPRHTVIDLEDDESENDAPETVTLLSAQDQARSGEEKAAKALERQTAEARKKRRERDAKLKEQAASSKKRKFHEMEENEAASTAPASTIPQHRPSKPKLPAFLPEEILLAEPTVRPPTPPFQHEAQKHHHHPLRKHKIFTEKPPKDVKRGPITIRVLETASKVLAPKVAKATSAIRQSWLAGRPGKNGQPSVERRKVGGGFLRR